MKKLIFVFLFLCLGYVSNAQNYASSIGLNAGYTQEGFGILANYSYYLDRYSAIHGGIFASFSNDEFKGEEIPYSLFSFQAGYTRNIWTSRNLKMTAALVGGGILGYEIINNGENKLDDGSLIDAENKFIYGAYVGANLNLDLNDSLAIYATVNEFYHHNSDIGNFVFYSGLGIKLFIF